MKYCVVIMDGAADLPIPQLGGKTCLESARTPHLDKLASEGQLGLTGTVPAGMEPSSACACLSILGYDPAVYYKGRAGIEARSMDIGIGEGEVVFRCNLVAVRDGRMWDYSAGHITSEEASALISALNESLGSRDVRFYPGVSYRHICKIRGQENTLEAVCTPPHDIPGKAVAGFLPRGTGSDFLRDLMTRSEKVLSGHPVNIRRRARGEVPATTIWLFWGSGPAPDMPSFKNVYGLHGAMTTGVDLLRGLAQMINMDVLEIKGVTDAMDNDYAAQATGAIKSLDEHDLVIIHIEAPDEAGHGGSFEEKIKAVEMVDREVIRRILSYNKDSLSVLVLPDHATPVKVMTHTGDPVPFLLRGPGFTPNGAGRFTEVEAKGTGVFVKEGYKIMGRLVGKVKA